MKNKFVVAMGHAPMYIKEIPLTRDLIFAAQRWFNNKLFTEIMDQDFRLNYSIYQSLVDLETRIQLDKRLKDVNYDKFLEFAAQAFGIEYSVEKK